TLPDKGESAVAIAMKHVTEAPTPPRRINPQIPIQLEALILRAMDKDPARRPRSATEFAELLTTYAQVSQQDTLVNTTIGNGRSTQRGPVNSPTRQIGNSSGTTNTGRINIPPPRQAPVRAPRQEGLGCGIFLVGMFILAGVLGVVLLFSTGTLSNIFGSMISNTTRPTVEISQTTVPTEISEPSATPDMRISVPPLVGLSDGAAQEQLLKLQLVPAPKAENNPTVSQGMVISQVVAPGELLKPGQPVTYTVSLGPSLVTVPDVRRLSSSLAQSQLTAVGLQVTVVEEPNATIDPGFVIAQSPSPDMRVAQGEAVTIRVSQGDVVRFPDVIGMTHSDAEALLKSSSELELIYVDVQGRDRLIDFDRYAPGQVVSAQIQGGAGISNGEFIPRGSRIILGVRADS
ncbi:MAG: PASTA domain-containing protein, partial [Oscillochloris sp.]|nr:PASTA domain-containing protein [Oscillochloris sp.]